MLHPNVLKAAGVDTSIYNGYAFGAGISRIVAIKYGINDIRLLTNGDLRFVKSR
jgi:phenylalanyl-tRNA synthetase alpha chain